jgi:hypothetical protein
MKTLHSEIKDLYKYIVEYDEHFSLSEIDEMDGFTRKEQLELKNKFISDILSSFVVIKKKFCACCNQYSIEEDIICGIWAESPEEAVDSYMETYE